MKLIIIYGAEATGKLTIAKQLVKKTSFNLFHNHVSIDVARTLFAYGEPEYNELLWDVRSLVFESAAKHDVPGLVFTWAYSHPDFEPLLDRLMGIMGRHNCTVHMVYVACAQKELEKRVVSADRIEAGKIHTVEALEHQQKAKNHRVIPNSNSLEIDNTVLSPDSVADQIISHFGLLAN